MSGRASERLLNCMSGSSGYDGCGIVFGVGTVLVSGGANDKGLE